MGTTSQVITWTLKIMGGESFSLMSLSGSPIEHSGGVTLEKFVGDQTELLCITKQIASLGCQIEIYGDQELTPQMKNLRSILSGDFSFINPEGENPT